MGREENGLYGRIGYDRYYVTCKIPRMVFRFRELPREASKTLELPERHAIFKGLLSANEIT